MPIAAAPILSPAVLESHVGILGKTGSGKSNLAKTIVEGLLDDGARVCVIDPTGTWYGLRLTRDRKPSPYQVVMFGGNHADIAIGRTHGAAVAEAIGTTTTPAVIDTRTMTVAERTEFFTAFAETLLQRNRGPLHLVIDEAHLFAPQGRVADPRSGAMVHAANNLVSLGRGIGLRIILISQRPAKLHKDSLTQVETLVALRLIAPQDRRAIEDWIGEWADPKQGAELVASLPSLRTGEAWIWSPEAGILERRQTPLARTLDTGKPSDQPIELASIDIAAMQGRLDEVAAEVLANDPATLRKRIRELEAAGGPARVETVERVVEVPVLNGEIAHLEAVAVTLGQVGQEITRVGADIVSAIARVSSAPRSAATVIPTGAAGTHAVPLPSGNPSQPARALRPPRVAGPSAIDPMILSALVDAPDGRPSRQVALLTGYSPAGGFFRRAMASLRERGIVDGTDPVRLTAQGREDAIGHLPIAMGRSLLESWIGNNRMAGAGVEFLEAIADAYPEVLTPARLGEITGKSPAGGYFRRSLKKLRDLGLISGTAEIRIAPELVEDRA